MTADGPSTPTVVGLVELNDGSEDIDLDRWVALAQRSLEAEGVDGPGELTLHFVAVDAMSELNIAHMEGAGPTDVLAFPLDADADDLLPGMPRLLGDIVVCPTVAQENAQTHGKSLDDELALLVVHGVLHILGHDHAEPDETARMKERERALLQAFHRLSPDGDERA